MPASVLLPAGLPAGQYPAGIVFIQWPKKWVFRPAAATRYPGKREIRHVYRVRNVAIQPPKPQNLEFHAQICPSGATRVRDFQENLSIATPL